KALKEIRRVVKPGGYLFLMPAFDVSRYAAGGYHARPLGDFDWKGKLTKVESFFTESTVFRSLYAPQDRLLRWVAARVNGPTRLDFVRLKPNYDQYWEADSDATTSFSQHELALWFSSRGDRCLNCDSELRQITQLGYPKLFMVVKV